MSCCSKRKKMQKWNYIKNWKCVKSRFAALWCSLVWARHLVSHLRYKFIMSGVRLWAEKILRIEWRCSSVRRVLCEVVFIKENSCSHRYVLPHRGVSSLGGSWGIVSGINVETLQRPQTHMLPSACHCIGAQSAPFGGLMVRFPLQLQMDY